MKRIETKTPGKPGWALIFCAVFAALAAIPLAVFSKVAGLIAVNAATVLFLAAMLLPGEKKEKE